METSSRSAPVRAEVLAAGLRAPYLRTGAGRPAIVLLPARGDGDGRWPALAEHLARALGGRCRLIVPDAPPAAEGLGAWLAAFADGLGVAGVGLVVAEPLADAARDLAVLEPELVARLVVLRQARGGDGAVPRFARVEREGIPLLELAIPAADAERGEGLELLLHFLAALAAS